MIYLIKKIIKNYEKFSKILYKNQKFLNLTMLVKNSGVLLMYKTYIIGTGYLSSKLIKKIKNAEIVSAQKFILRLDSLNKDKKKFNLIINSFYSARKLSNLTSYKLFVEKVYFKFLKFLTV